MTDYYDLAFEAFEVLLRNNDDEQVNRFTKHLI